MMYRRLIPALLLSTVLFSAGCSQRSYYVAPPPPPPGPSMLVDQAQQNGFRAGMESGQRDAYNGFGYRPRHDRAFHDTPGYYPQFGPHGMYQSYFRDAFMRGYDKGFYRR
jgi:hypothetical protein